MGFLGSGWGDEKGGTKTDYIVGGTVAGLGLIGYGTYKVAEFLGEKHDVIQEIAGTTLAGTSLFLVGGMIGVGGKVYQELKKEPVKALKITPKEKIKIKPDNVWKMVHSFRSLYMKRPWHKRQWLKWRITRDNQGITFKVICPATEHRSIESKLKRAFPDCSVSECSVDIPFDVRQGYVTHLTLSEKSDKTMGLRNDRKNVIGDALYLMPENSVFEITFSPSSMKDIKKAVKQKVKSLRENKDRDTEEAVKRVKERVANSEGIERTAFTCYMDIWSQNEPDGFIGELSAATEKYGSKLQGRPYQFLVKKRNPFLLDDPKRRLLLWQANKLTDTELASFLMLPDEKHPVWQHIETAIPRPKVNPEDFQGDYGIGYIDSDDPKQNGRIAKLRVKTFMNHGLISGASGGGKGSTLGMLAKLDFLKEWVKDPEAAAGMTICDPHGTTLYLWINYLLELERQGYEIPWERVKCVSFGTQGMEEFPVALNLLHRFEGDAVDQVADDTAEAILNAFNSANMSKGISDLQRALQALIGAGKTYTIADIGQLMKNTPVGEELREAILDSENPNVEVMRWLADKDAEIAKTKKSLELSSVDTRLAAFITKIGMQRMFIRKENYFDVARILKDGNLVLIDFKGAPKETYKLLAGWLTRRYYYESQKRGEGQRPHILCFDEVQKFDAQEVFTDIICENRKFNMGLLLVTQMISRLDDQLAEAITSNAGFVLSVRQEAGAPGMAKLLGSEFSAEELTKLEPGLEAAIKSIDGVARLKLDYPAFLDENGKATWINTPQEAEAIQRAKDKFRELLARDHKTAKAVDKEVAELLGVVQMEDITN
jgi:hypothetical protein